MCPGICQPPRGVSSPQRLTSGLILAGLFSSSLGISAGTFLFLNKTAKMHASLGYKTFFSPPPQLHCQCDPSFIPQPTVSILMAHFSTWNLFYYMIIIFLLLQMATPKPSFYCLLYLFWESPPDIPWKHEPIPWQNECHIYPFQVFQT